jgi:hypothetical protein
MFVCQSKNAGSERWNLTSFLLTHHALQRLAERCGARMPLDLLGAVNELGGKSDCEQPPRSWPGARPTAEALLRCLDNRRQVQDGGDDRAR